MGPSEHQRFDREVPHQQNASNGPNRVARECNSYADRGCANGFLLARIAAGEGVRLCVYIATVDGNVLTGDKIAVGTG
jgi:hypothetical protein